jgi:hypothetical protein
MNHVQHLIHCNLPALPWWRRGLPDDKVYEYILKNIIEKSPASITSFTAVLSW